MYLRWIQIKNKRNAAVNTPIQAPRLLVIIRLKIIARVLIRLTKINGVLEFLIESQSRAQEKGNAKANVPAATLLWIDEPVILSNVIWGTVLFIHLPIKFIIPYFAGAEKKSCWIGQ